MTTWIIPGASDVVGVLVMRSPGGGRSTPDGVPARDTATCIVLIEPRLLVRECFGRCLEEASGYRVAAYPTVQSWLNSPEKARGTLALYCWRGDNDIAKQSDLGQLIGVIPTVVMSDVEEPEQIVQAMDRGIRGFIPASLSLYVVVEALRLVRAGGVFVPANTLLPALRGRGGSPAAPARDVSEMFTARQAAVVEAIGKGKANKIIAHELNMRESTVKVHVRNIMKKLSAKNRTEVALMVNRLMSEQARAG